MDCAELIIQQEEMEEEDVELCPVLATIPGITFMSLSASRSILYQFPTCGDRLSVEPSHWQSNYGIYSVKFTL
jgi:hypothetical protein